MHLVGGDPEAPRHIALVGVLDEPALAVSVDDAVTVVRRVRAAVPENLHRAPMLRRVL